MPLQAETRETRDFAREIKFLVDATTGQGIRDWVRARFAPDPYGSGTFGDEYRTTTLYFDTEAFDVFHRRGSFGRSKYRVRRYGSGSQVFLERKLRNPSMLTKRRTAIPLGALDRLHDSQPAAGWSGYWFQQRLHARRLAPTCHLSYHRTARVAMTPQGPARITIDDSLRALPTTGLAFRTESGIDALDRQMIIEMKYRHDMPVILKQLVQEFRLNSKPVSKYRLGISALGQATEAEASNPAELQAEILCA
jgi:hypothetical protein